jgi:NAD(P)-dependent dehydrogenase (short-subunit alcohol dehydrogenase family)
MKLRTIVLIAVAAGIGWSLARKASREDPNVVRGSRDEARPRNSALRLVQGPAQRLADQATVRSLDAIRSARRALRDRLAGDGDASWT